MIYMNVKLIEEQESCWLACGWKRINDKNLNKLSKLRSMSSNHLSFTWEKPAPPTRAGKLCRVTRANYIYFPTKPGIRYTFSFYNLHINRACEMKSYLENAGQDNICRVYGALTCLPPRRASPL